MNGQQVTVITSHKPTAEDLMDDHEAARQAADFLVALSKDDRQGVTQAAYGVRNRLDPGYRAIVVDLDPSDPSRGWPHRPGPAG